MASRTSSRILQDTSIFTKDYLRRVMSVRPRSQLIWQLSDPIGRIVAELRNKRLNNVELFDNGGFEIAGAGGADIWANTIEAPGNGAIADETVLVHTGGSAHAAKLTSGVGLNTYLTPANAASGNNQIIIIPGEVLTLSFWTRGDGTNAGRFRVFDNSNSANILGTQTTGITGTTYTQVSVTFTIPTACYSLIIYLWGPGVNGGIAYFDDVSLIGNISYNGRYAAAGMTYGVEGIGDGNVAARFSGADTGLLIGSKAFAQFWNGNKGSVIAWGKVDAATRWLDATSYRYLFHVKSRQNAAVYIVIGKNQTNHQLVWRRRVVSSTYEKTYTFSPIGPTDWFCMSYVWDRVSTPKRFAGHVYAPNHTVWTKVFDEVPSVGYGDQDWPNSSYTCDDANSVLAGGNLASQEWFGDEYLCVYWKGQTLTDEEMKKVMIPTER